MEPIAAGKAGAENSAATRFILKIQDIISSSLLHRRYRDDGNTRESNKITDFPPYFKNKLDLSLINSPAAAAFRTFIVFFYSNTSNILLVSIEFVPQIELTRPEAERRASLRFLASEHLPSCCSRWRGWLKRDVCAQRSSRPPRKCLSRVCTRPWNVTKKGFDMLKSVSYDRKTDR